MNAPFHLPSIAGSTESAKLPSSYQAAKEALAACEAIDECKDWADRMAALASYAAQAKDEELLVEPGASKLEPFAESVNCSSRLRARVAQTFRTSVGRAPS